MPKGQERAWKDFWKSERQKREKKKIKGTTKKLQKKFKRSPFQCSICLNPRGGRMHCYLCDEEESVVQQDWILMNHLKAEADKQNKRTRKTQSTTLTQML